MMMQQVEQMQTYERQVQMAAKTAAVLTEMATILTLILKPQSIMHKPTDANMNT
jgi:hypothetical protein